MKTKFLLISTLIMSLSFTACALPPFGKKKVACEEWMQLDSLIKQELSNSLTETLFSPKKVRCYHLLHKQEIKKGDVQPIKGYVRDTLLCNLQTDQIAVFQYLLLSNAQSYSEEIISIEAPYIPILEFEFIGNKKKLASVIISLSDRSWCIIYDGKLQFKYNYADAKLFERFCKYFVELYINKK